MLEALALFLFWRIRVEFFFQGSWRGRKSQDFYRSWLNRTVFYNRNRFSYSHIFPAENSVYRGRNGLNERSLRCASIQSNAQNFLTCREKSLYATEAGPDVLVFLHGLHRKTSHIHWPGTTIEVPVQTCRQPCVSPAREPTRFCRRSALTGGRRSSARGSMRRHRVQMQRIHHHKAAYLLRQDRGARHRTEDVRRNAREECRRVERHDIWVRTRKLQRWRCSTRCVPDGLRPDQYTFASVLCACARMAALERVHGVAVK
jgi:hypothetical protein